MRGWRGLRGRICAHLLLPATGAAAGLARASVALLRDDLRQLLLGLLLHLVGEEVRELGQQIGVVAEQIGHLVENLLDAPLLLLVRVKHLEERLVRLGLVREALLDRRHVVDGVVELNRLLGATCTSTSEAVSERAKRVAANKGGSVLEPR